MRLALVEAGQGRIGSLVDRLHVLCYGLDPLTGASTGLAQTMLRTGATLTLSAPVASRSSPSGGARSARWRAAVMGFPLLPGEASTQAVQTDRIFSG